MGALGLFAPLEPGSARNHPRSSSTASIEYTDTLSSSSQTLEAQEAMCRMLSRNIEKEHLHISWPGPTQAI
ncbi:hypothetical protein CC78DRAFT_583701 [Lojkania enalia]|uniref:Uncharacterized protein n=1 Tax=Lojkania enalia TaxID=147567 RepID=A0A9P4N444_9PLEO|nr:hypothetical protein CC78DRAFT_583701 [Didymosphaeria enalia]